MDRVLVLHAILPAEPDPESFGGLLERLPYARRLELGRRGARERHASLAGLHLVLCGAERLLGRVASAGELRFPAGARPVLVAGPNFSVSHSATRVAAALCTSFEVGLDLEDLPTPAVAGQEGSARLLRWTATEAVLKAAGLGLREVSAVTLDDDLGRGSIGERTWWLRRVAIDPAVVAQLAVPSGDIALEVARVDLQGD